MGNPEIGLPLKRLAWKIGGSTKSVRAGLALAAVSAYVLAFIPPFQPEHFGIVELAATPVVVAAWLLGFWGGIFAAMVAIPANAVLKHLLTGDSGGVLEVLTQPGALEGSVLLLILGAVLGGLRDVAEQIRREILARNQVERERNESEERYRFVTESASDGIVTLDENRIVLFSNPAAEKIFGRKTAELTGKPLSTLMPEGVRVSQDEAVREHLEQLAVAEARRALQMAAEKRGAGAVELEVSFGGYVRNGEHVYTGIFRDITETKAIQAALKEAKDSAEHANQAKSEFLSRMSHELRTPLNAILGFARLMQLAPDLDEEHRESTEQIVRAGEHLLALVEEILDIARIEAGRISLSIEEVHVGAVVRDAWTLIQYRAAERSIQWNVDFDCCDRHVLADRKRLKQVLINLLSNAVKYNRDGGTVQARCDVTRQGMVRIEITDSGQGISVEAQERLFAPFERLGADRTQIEGTGIGLAVCKGLMEAMNGFIGVNSREGSGSTFWIELPLAEATEENTELQAANMPAAGSL